MADDLDEYIQGYEYCHDNGGYYPSDREKALILDAIIGWENTLYSTDDIVISKKELEGMRNFCVVGIHLPTSANFKNLQHKIDKILTKGDKDE